MPRDRRMRSSSHMSLGRCWRCLSCWKQSCMCVLTGVRPPIFSILPNAHIAVNRRSTNGFLPWQLLRQIHWPPCYAHGTPRSVLCNCRSKFRSRRQSRPHSSCSRLLCYIPLATVSSLHPLALALTISIFCPGEHRIRMITLALPTSGGTCQVQYYHARDYLLCTSNVHLDILLLFIYGIYPRQITVPRYGIHGNIGIREWFTPHYVIPRTWRSSC